MASSETTTLCDRYDVVVIGSGLSGLTTAVVAAEAGASVLVVEKQPGPGGTLPLTSGHVWHSFAMRDDVPDTDPRLRGIVSEDFDVLVQWLRDHGVDLSVGTGRVAGFQIQPHPVSGLLEPLIARLQELGGALLLDAQVSALEQSTDGAITGVRIAPDGRLIEAGAVIIATGGFQGAADLVSEYIMPAEKLFWRSNPGTTGDGFRMGRSVGVGLSAGMSAFYGHLSPHQGDRPAPVEPMTYRRATLGCLEHVAILNLQGERFIDETSPDVAVAQALAQDEKAIGVVVFDEPTHQEYVTQRNALPEDARSALPLWEAVGGRIEKADTVRGALENLADVGLDVGAAVTTIEDFDRAAQVGSDESLPVPRKANLHRVATGPFYALLVCPDLTFTDGGLAVDERGRALDENGDPIRGLYVVGEAAGLLSLASQAGGIATALATGIRAGTHVTTSATATNNDTEQ